MSKNINRNICPLCGLEASFLENEVTFVSCKKCGDYTFHISVHPFLFEMEYRNQLILKILSDMAEMAGKDNNKFEIDFMLYQELEKKYLCSNSCV